MKTYFVFSDECGAYTQKPNEGFLSSHPYYARASILIPALEYRNLSRDYASLKKRFNLPNEKEIKWSYQWTLRKHQKNNRSINDKHELYFLKEHDYHELIDFVEKSLSLVASVPGVVAVTTISKNHSNWKMPRKRFFQMHIENHMQRVQYEMTGNKNNIAVLFFDSVNSKIDKLLRNAYSDLIKNNRFEVDFSHIKDSLNIEYSHQSIGVQMADFMAGAVNAFLKAQDNPGNYARGLKMFKESVHPILRCIDGEICGYGIMEIPRDDGFREEIRNYLDTP